MGIFNLKILKLDDISDCKFGYFILIVLFYKNHGFFENGKIKIVKYNIQAVLAYKYQKVLIVV